MVGHFIATRLSMHALLNARRTSGGPALSNIRLVYLKVCFIEVVFVTIVKLDLYEHHFYIEDVI